MLLEPVWYEYVIRRFTCQSVSRVPCVYQSLSRLPLRIFHWLPKCSHLSSGSTRERYIFYYEAIMMRMPSDAICMRWAQATVYDTAVIITISISCCCFVSSLSRTVRLLTSKRKAWEVLMAGCAFWFHLLGTKARARSTTQPTNNCDL